MKTWKLEKTVQCAKCPWKKNVDPYTIPNGYHIKKHKALINTIATPGKLCLDDDFHVMTCHETEKSHCIGWLNNQLNQGNNLQLRLQVMSCENVKDIVIVGEQHYTFEETIPKEK